VADYVASFDLVRDAADFIVVNVSSPNTAGLRAMQRASTRMPSSRRSPIAPGAPRACS